MIFHEKRIAAFKSVAYGVGLPVGLFWLLSFSSDMTLTLGLCFLICAMGLKFIGSAT